MTQGKVKNMNTLHKDRELQVWITKGGIYRLFPLFINWQMNFSITRLTILSLKCQKITFKKLILIITAQGEVFKLLA